MCIYVLCIEKESRLVIMTKNELSELEKTIKTGSCDTIYKNHN